MSESKRQFRNRSDAGSQLGTRLVESGIGGSDALVLALPRGGVPVACEVAGVLGAPVDVLVVRKIGVPGHPELAAGSIASGGIKVLNPWILEALGIDESELEPIVAREQRELARRERLYRGGRPLPELAGRWVVLVDDGAATGATMQAAVEVVRDLSAKRITVALPTSSREAAQRFRAVADDVLVLAQPEPYYAVGSSYEDFNQLRDEDVAAWLERAARERPRDARNAASYGAGDGN